MNCRHITALLILTTTLFLGIAFVGPAHAVSPTGYGPESPELNLYYFPDGDSMYSALKAGRIDMDSQVLTPDQIPDAIKDPNIILDAGPKLDLRAWSLNNNATIAALPGKRSVTSDASFRKALWCLTDLRCMDVTQAWVPVAAPSRAWVNKSVEDWVKVNYAYNIQEASEYLDADGFIQRDGLGGRPGPDPNPYYDAAVPGSARYWRGYPSTWPSAGARIDPVVFSARVDDTLRYAASVRLRDTMLMSGIQVNFIAEPFSSAFFRVMIARNYHIYSAAWSVGRFATYLYHWLHTSGWITGGLNCHVSPTSPGYDLCTEPDKRPEDKYDLDYWASKVRYPDTLPDAITAAKNVQSLFVQKYVPFIPLWSTQTFYAYRNLYGVVCMEGIGPVNKYTFMSLRRADGGTPIRVGVMIPIQLNQIYSNWLWEVTPMEQTMDDFYNLQPYDILIEQPGLAQDWTNAPGGPSTMPGTWVDPDDGKTKSMMRYWFLEDPTDGSYGADSPTTHSGDADAEWIKQGTPAQGGGTVLADFAEHWLRGGYEFNSWYYDTEAAGALYTNYRDIKHIECHTGPNVGDNYAEVYFDVFSYWTFTWPWGRHIYAVEPASYDQTLLGWKTSPLSQQETRTFGPMAAGTYLHTRTPTGGGPAIPRRARGTPVEVISMTIDGAPATKATTPHLYDPATGLGANGDYSIVGSSGNGPSIRVFKTVTSSLTVTYWARGDPAGYWPGNTNFQTTLTGTGQYYMTDFQPGAGGYATYKANPHNYMATPWPGEIDWLWYWRTGSQPRDGCYKLDIFDGTYFSAAMHSTGTGEPIPPGGNGPRPPTRYWQPGADVVPLMGEIDINDMAILGANYDKNCSSPYPNIQHPPAGRDVGPGPHP